MKSEAGMDPWIGVRIERDVRANGPARDGFPEVLLHPAKNELGNELFPDFDADTHIVYLPSDGPPYTAACFKLGIGPEFFGIDPRANPKAPYVPQGLGPVMEFWCESGIDCTWCCPDASFCSPDPGLP